MIDGELPASVEGLRRLAFDLGGVRDRVTAVERAVAGRLLPFDTGPGDLVGFDADGNPVLIDAAAGDGYGLTSDTSQTGGVAWEKRRKTQQWYTGATNTGPIAAGGASGAFLAAPTFAADGTSTYLIEWGCTGVAYVSAGPGVNRWDLILVDAGVEIAALPGYLCSSNVFPWNYGQVERVLSAGNHSITMHMRNQTGATSTAAFSGSANSPLWIRVNKVVPA